jgi:hypothetical protein
MRLDQAQQDNPSRLACTQAVYFPQGLGIHIKQERIHNIGGDLVSPPFPEFGGGVGVTIGKCINCS